MGNYSQKFAVNIDFQKNSALNIVIENVAALPAICTLGRVVVFEGALYIGTANSSSTDDWKKLQDASGVPVQDVKVNGTTIVSDNVASITTTSASSGVTDESFSTKGYVDNAIATLATFRGSYYSSGTATTGIGTLGLAWADAADKDKIKAALGTTVTSADNNDYAYVLIRVAEASADAKEIQRYKCTVSGSTKTWAYEYSINTSAFTEAQWAAINSGVTSTMVTSLLSGMSKLTSSDAWSAADTSYPTCGAVDAKFVAQVDGKGLSTEDYTTEEKTKLSGIAAGAQVNVLEAVKIGDTALTITDKAVTIPSASDSQTGLMSSADYTRLKEVAAGAQVNVIEKVKVGSSDLSVDAEKRVTIPSASASAEGTMSSSDFSKLAGIAAGAQVNIIETVKVDEVALTVTEKAVNIDLATPLANKVTKNADITAGTACKVTYDSKGLVTAGENLSASDIPNLDASKINSGILARAQSYLVEKTAAINNVDSITISEFPYGLTVVDSSGEVIQCAVTYTSGSATIGFNAAITGTAYYIGKNTA